MALSGFQMYYVLLPLSSTVDYSRYNTKGHTGNFSGTRGLQLIYIFIYMKLLEICISLASSLLCAGNKWDLIKSNNLPSHGFWNIILLFYFFYFLIMLGFSGLGERYLRRSQFTKKKSVIYAGRLGLVYNMI